MSKLQNALADYERPALAEWMKDHPMLGVIMEAARRVANLDYEVGARTGHDAYERLAPEYGYTTRQKSRVSWERLPQEHRDLMVAAYTVAIDAALSITTEDE